MYPGKGGREIFLTFFIAIPLASLTGLCYFCANEQDTDTS